jgi:hypothetical protein
VSAEDTEFTDAELYKIQREESKVKRAKNREASSQMLRNAGIEFISHNFGDHLIIRLKPGVVFDFWPGTGKWILRGSKVYKRGVRNLLAAIAHAKQCNGGPKP